MNARRRVDHEAAFVLHSYPYKETSLIIEAFSHRHGRVALMARGARRPRSALRGVLHAFQPLRLSWSGSGELSTLVQAEWQGGFPFLSGFGLMCGFYLNELILRLVPREDPHEGLFDAYQRCIQGLGLSNQTAATLREFERSLLSELGYAMQLQQDAQNGEPIDPAEQYRYDPDLGPVRARESDVGDLVVRGQTLLDLGQNVFSDTRSMTESRDLMRALIASKLHGQPLHTRHVLMELQDL